MVRVDGDPVEIPGAAGQARIAVGEGPGVTAVVRAIQAGILARLNQRINALAVRRDSHADAAPIAARQAMTHESRPARATAGRAVESATRSLQRSVGTPRRAVRFPC